MFKEYRKACEDKELLSIHLDKMCITQCRTFNTEILMQNLDGSSRVIVAEQADFILVVLQ